MSDEELDQMAEHYEQERTEKAARRIRGASHVPLITPGIYQVGRTTEFHGYEQGPTTSWKPSQVFHPQNFPRVELDLYSMSVGQASEGDECEVCTGWTSRHGGTISGETIGHLCYGCETWARRLIGGLGR